MRNASPSTMLTAALWYVQQKALAVLPFHEVKDGGCSCRKGAGCESPGKHPRTKHGYKDATTDHGQVLDWWSRSPNANVGMPTGQVNRITVLDADDQEAIGLIEKHCPEGTLSQTTPSGGKQYFFIYEERLKNWVKVLFGLDIRNDGSQVVLPPSPGRSWDEVDGGYKPVAKMPESLVDEILSASKRKDRFVSSTARTLSKVVAAENVDLSEDLNGGLEDAKTRFKVGERIPEGTRYHTLRQIGSSMRGLGVPEEKIILAIRWVNANLCDPPLGDDELSKIVDSILKLKADINNLVDAYEVWLESLSLKGMGGATEKRLYKTLFRIARGVGKKGIRGLEVSVSQHDLAKESGIKHQPTVNRALQRMPHVGSEKRSKDITHSDTIVILYPNGSYVDELGELQVNPFFGYDPLSSNSHNPYTSSSSKGNSNVIEGGYKGYDFARKSRRGKGRPGFAQMDVLEKIVGNIGPGAPFKSKDCSFLKKEAKDISNNLCKLANSEWGWLERVSRGVYVVPEDIHGRYERYRVESGEMEDEKEQAEDAKKKRAIFGYKVDLGKAFKEGRNLEEVEVPEDVSKEDASTILYSWRLKRAASEGRNLDEVDVPENVRRSKSTKVIEREQKRQKNLIEDRIKRTAVDRMMSGRSGWATMDDYFKALDDVHHELNASVPPEAPGSSSHSVSGDNGTYASHDSEPTKRNSGPTESLKDNATDKEEDPTLLLDFGERQEDTPARTIEEINDGHREIFRKVFGPDWNRGGRATTGPHGDEDFFYQEDVFAASSGRYARPKIGRDFSERVRGSRRGRIRGLKGYGPSDQDIRQTT